MGVPYIALVSILRCSQILKIVMLTQSSERNNHSHIDILHTPSDILVIYSTPPHAGAMVQR